MNAVFSFKRIGCHLMLVAVAAAIVGCDTIVPGPPISTEWLSSAAYQTKVEHMIAARYYPQQVEGRRNGSTEEYRATFVPYPFGNFRFYAHHGLPGPTFHARDTQLSNEGLARISLQTFVDAKGATRHQAVWTNRGNSYASSSPTSTIGPVINPAAAMLQSSQDVLTGNLWSSNSDVPSLGGGLYDLEIHMPNGWRSVNGVTGTEAQQLIRAANQYTIKGNPSYRNLRPSVQSGPPQYVPYKSN